MKKVFATVLIAALAGCQKEEVANECVEKPDNGMACYTLYDPVCGCNGKTYGNSCEAGRVGIAIVSKGECKK
ncbi:protease inhibitor Kazal-type [Runella sp. CRIBMP]|uniref:Protease inhibitor Kazal-type n=1 Tax=Runella salmonicolor TaxID=2950278 RepID=A0ABT1FUG9_9BACT|nr:MULTISPECIES: protease inhibitor Kazal-type [Runella]MCP1384137.1 protease inhibitor Kazal-type [Runella salmonicolor]NBB19887.1 protease inhibitor Kazal-type [Runella sp. CRIBMP]